MPTNKIKETTEQFEEEFFETQVVEKTNKKITEDAIIQALANTNKIDEVVRKADAVRTTKRLVDLEIKQKQFLEEMKRAPKRSISIAPHYANSFGNVMRISINSVCVYVPCDGRSYDVPEMFADEAMNRMQKVNKKINMMKQSANGGKELITFDNTSAGSVKIF